MLKKAAEMAEAAQAARASAVEETRAEQERAAEAARRQALLDERHRSFEIHALTSARAGELATTVCGHELSLDRLRVQGFIAAQLTRRLPLEEHLSSLLSRKKEELTQVAERAVSACPGLGMIDDDGLLHRNPLISMLETLWRQAQLSEPFDLAVVLTSILNQSAVKCGDLDENKNRLANVLKVFSEVKSIEQKYRTVCWENLTIPAGSDRATYVCWESAFDGRGTAVSFSAKRLKWLATQWPTLAASLGEYIAEEASRGSNAVELFVWRTKESWRLSLDWPPEFADGDIGDAEAMTATFWEDAGEEFCAPTLVAEELSLFGYSVSIEPQQLHRVPSATASSPAEERDAVEIEVDAHRLKIQWE